MNMKIQTETTHIIVAMFLLSLAWII